MPPAALALHPEHQEVHLQRLALDTRGQQWQLAPGSEATVRYGGDAIVGREPAARERRSADYRRGHVRPPGRRAARDADQRRSRRRRCAAACAQPQLSGRLNASADVTGTRQEPKVEGTFDVAQGGFRQFKYDALDGHAGRTRAAASRSTRGCRRTRRSGSPRRDTCPPRCSAATRPMPARQQIDFDVDSSPIEPRRRPGLHERAHRCDRQLPGAPEDRRDRRRSAGVRRGDARQGRADGRRDRRPLHEHRRADRRPAGSRPHRRDHAARQSLQSALAERRSRHRPAPARARAALRHGRRFQDHRQRDRQRAHRERARDRRHAARRHMSAAISASPPATLNLDASWRSPGRLRMPTEPIRVPDRGRRDGRAGATAGTARRAVDGRAPDGAQRPRRESRPACRRPARRSASAR